MFFSFSFSFHNSPINPKYNSTQYTTPKYIQNTALHKNKLKLKITEKVLYMIVFKIDRLRRSSLNRLTNRERAPP